MGVKEAFDKVAGEYDLSRKILIPCFDEFYGAVVRLLRIQGSTAPRILDLGVGTGLLSALVLEEYPNASIVGVDLSAKMLAQAHNRLGGRVELVEGDYLKDDFGQGYDVIISSLSIHHLEGESKAKLFEKAYQALNINGIFINADQVEGRNERIERVNRDVWYEQMHSGGISAELLSASEERMREDKMSTLEDQLLWLEQAGFVYVNCWYQNFIFTVFSGIKGYAE